MTLPGFMQNSTQIKILWKSSVYVLSKIRQYFRIQAKRATCSKRVSYLGNTSWPCSPKLIKVLVKIGLNRLSSLQILSWYITLFTVSYFVPDISKNLVKTATEISRFVTLFFQELTEISPLNCKTFRENFL